MLASTSWQITRPLRQMAALRGRKGTPSPTDVAAPSPLGRRRERDQLRPLEMRPPTQRRSRTSHSPER